MPDNNILIESQFFFGGLISTKQEKKTEDSIFLTDKYLFRCNYNYTVQVWAELTLKDLWAIS